MNSVSGRDKISDSGRILAVIDIGSNSTHMMIADVRPDGSFQPLECIKEQTRLAADLNDKLLLDANALTKMSLVLRRMKDVADKYGAAIRCVATHSLREARNGVEFSGRLSKKTGIQVDVISGPEEARLVSLGVRFGLPVADVTSLIVDVGGGSTEIILCRNDQIKFVTSLKLGAVRLTKRFLDKDPFSQSDLSALEDYVVSRLEPVCAEIRSIGFELAIGSSGTIKALQMLSIASQGGEAGKNFHGTDFALEDLQAISYTLFKNRSIRERLLLPKMDSKRADIIVAGAMVLKVLGELAGVSFYRVSSTALREGLVVDTISRDIGRINVGIGDVRWQSISELGRRLRVEEQHSFHIMNLALSLFDGLGFEPKIVQRWRDLLKYSAFLHECGKFVNISGHHKHAHYLIINSNLMGFNQSELEVIASLVRFHRKRTARLNDEDLGRFDQDDAGWIVKFSSLLRLAVSLDRGRLRRVERVHLAGGRSGKSVLTVGFKSNEDNRSELYELNCEKEPFEKAFGTTLEVRVQYAGK